MAKVEGGGGKSAPGATRPNRAAPKRKPVRGASSRPAGLFTWLTVGLIVAVILVIVVVKVTSSSPAVSGVFVPTSPTIASELTDVPASVFNTIGVNTQGYVAVNAPTLIKNQPPLNWKQDGSVRPTVYYYGAEWCPYCAAERWPLIIALSRFGTFTGIGNMQSSSTDIYKDTQTFTLWKATFKSAYINLFHVEYASNVPSGAGYKNLEVASTTEDADLAMYDSSVYFPKVVQPGTMPIPYVSFNNKYFIVGASYSPQALAGLTRSEIAGNLAITQNHLTQGIIAAANYITASICATTSQQPSAVCNSTGVRAADTALKITP